MPEPLGTVVCSPFWRVLRAWRWQYLLGWSFLIGAGLARVSGVQNNRPAPGLSLPKLVGSVLALAIFVWLAPMAACHNTFQAY